MNRAIVIADDLTGANDTGAMLANEEYIAFSSPTADVDEALGKAQVLTINADSRAMSRNDAYAQVRKLTERFGGQAALLSKRIDTTLRGNIGAEIDAVLDGLGGEARACVVTAAPRAGRTCRNGRVYVHGVPLEKTDVARDVRCPIDTSDVCEMIRRQSQRQTALIPLDAVRGDLLPALQGCAAEIIAFDAETDEDIERIAKAVSTLRQRVVAVDPGNFTVAFAKQILPKRVGRTLLLLGSRSEPTLRQLEYMEAKGTVRPVRPDIDKLLFQGEKQELARVLAELNARAETDDVLCATLIGTEISDRSRREAQRLSDAFAALGAYVLERMPQIDLCFACGGDVCQSLMRAIGAKGVRLRREVIPLAVYGEVIGGRCQGLRLLTKGGMIGGEDAIDVMLQYAQDNR